MVEETLALTPAIRADQRADDTACRDEHYAQWRALAAGIAGRPRMRVSRDGGRTYPRRNERAITEEAPNQPAAVLIYDNTGSARTLCVDLDTSKGGRAAVQRDFAAVTAILTRVGARFFADQSPNGGIHVYVPLAEPLPLHTARVVTRALAARTPTMDPMPMMGIDSGCIRPPGGRHKSGGHQKLIGSLTEAWTATKQRTTAEAWARLTTELAVDVFAASSASAEKPADVVQLRPLGRHDTPDAAYQAIARTGDFDTSRYATPSEARQGVIWAAVAAGWDITDVATRLADGRWAGLAAMYAQYRPNSRHGAVVRDWNAAVRFEKKRREITRRESVRVGTTREPKTHGAGVHQQIRTWLNAVELIFDENRRDDLAARAVLTALAEAAQKTASLTIEFGNRSLAIATGLDQATVGKCLNRLVEESDPLLELLIPSSGVKANLYQLVLPQSVAEAAQRRTWKKGNIRGIRGAFRELGLPAAFMYAALEQHSSPAGGRDLATEARLGTTTAYDALATLQAFGLAHRTAEGWSIGAANLDTLAEALGIVDQVKAQLERYREERRAYWAMLGIIRLAGTAGTVGNYNATPPPEDPEPPDYAAITLMDMLEAELGAHLIDEISNQRAV